VKVTAQGPATATPCKTTRQGMDASNMNLNIFTQLLFSYWQSNSLALLDSYHLISLNVFICDTAFLWSLLLAKYVYPYLVFAFNADVHDVDH